MSVFHLRHMIYLTTAQFVPLLVSFPLGRGLARVVPEVRIWGLPLNPGPFTIKEHVLVTVMSSVGAVAAYAVSL